MGTLDTLDEFGGTNRVAQMARRDPAIQTALDNFLNSRPAVQAQEEAAPKRMGTFQMEAELKTKEAAAPAIAPETQNELDKTLQSVLQYAAKGALSPEEIALVKTAFPQKSQGTGINLKDMKGLEGQNLALAYVGGKGGLSEAQIEEEHAAIKKHFPEAKFERRMSKDGRAVDVIIGVDATTANAVITMEKHAQKGKVQQPVQDKAPAAQAQAEPQAAKSSLTPQETALDKEMRAITERDTAAINLRNAAVKIMENGDLAKGSAMFRTAEELDNKLIAQINAMWDKHGEKAFNESIARIDTGKIARDGLNVAGEQKAVQQYDNGDFSPTAAKTAAPQVVTATAAAKSAPAADVKSAEAVREPLNAQEMQTLDNAMTALAKRQATVQMLRTGGDKLMDSNPAQASQMLVLADQHEKKLNAEFKGLTEKYGTTAMEFSADNINYSKIVKDNVTEKGEKKLASQFERSFTQFMKDDLAKTGREMKALGNLGIKGAKAVGNEMAEVGKAAVLLPVHVAGNTMAYGADTVATLADKVRGFGSKLASIGVKHDAAATNVSSPVDNSGKMKEVATHGKAQ